jgi:hypothetical protein
VVRALDVQVVEPSAACAAGEYEWALDSGGGRLRDPAEGCALVPSPTRDLDVRFPQAPGVDRHRLLDHVLQPEPAHLVGHERDRRPLFRRARAAKAQRVRAKRLRTFDDLLQVCRRDRLLELGDVQSPKGFVGFVPV